MSTTNIQLYDIFKKDLKLEDNRAKACADTIQETIQSEIMIKQAEHEKQFTNQMQQISETLLRIDTKFENLKGHVDKQHEILKGLIIEHRGSTDTKIESIKGSFDTKIESLKGNFDTKIESLKGNFDTKIESLKGSIDTKIESLKGDFNSKLKDQEIALTNKMADMNKWNISIFISVLILIIGCILNLFFKFK